MSKSPQVCPKCGAWVIEVIRIPGGERMYVDVEPDGAYVLFENLEGEMCAVDTPVYEQHKCKAEVADGDPGLGSE